ncbi:periplasmic heavy metal sensor [Rhodopseudomonas palustris]|uniref:Periplasmic heavy metal sensor n=1 Tax=Rhodopseudomonas palustris TaxID=1076 RepID=A0A418VM14_RHOPL|nr:periplasmic heavy metal sensor [Rhodopseudomonas palustris]RJF77160.1 periplasmic heavy metal sensor [Rhodopseudomonas palustris]
MTLRIGSLTGGRLLLLASLCLNVALGAYVGAQWLQPEWAPNSAGTPIRLIERVATRLPSDDAEILRRNFQARQPQLQPLQAAYMAALMKTLRLTGQAELDKPALQAAIKDAREKRIRIGDEVIDTFVETLEQISPKGRRQLVGGMFR